MTTVDMLNRAFEKDPEAIRALMINYVPCNMDLADDKFIVCRLDQSLHVESYTVSALGLINGILSANNLPLVATKWEINDKGPNKFVGFCDVDN